MLQLSENCSTPYFEQIGHETVTLTEKQSEDYDKLINEFKEQVGGLSKEIFIELLKENPSIKSAIEISLMDIFKDIYTNEFLDSFLNDVTKLKTTINKYGLIFPDYFNQEKIDQVLYECIKYYGYISQEKIDKLLNLGTSNNEVNIFLDGRAAKMIRHKENKIQLIKEIEHRFNSSTYKKDVIALKIANPKLYVSHEITEDFNHLIITFCFEELILKPTLGYNQYAAKNWKNEVPHYKNGSCTFKIIIEINDYKKQSNKIIAKWNEPEINNWFSNDRYCIPPNPHCINSFKFKDEKWSLMCQKDENVNVGVFTILDNMTQFLSSFYSVCTHHNVAETYYENLSFGIKALSRSYKKFCKENEFKKSRFSCYHIIKK